MNGFGNTNSAAKDPPTSISYIAGNCSDGTRLPDFSYDFNNPNWSTCTRLNYSSGYTYLSQLYTYQDATYNLSSLAERFTYRQAFWKVAPCSCTLEVDVRLMIHTHSHLCGAYASVIIHLPPYRKFLGSSKQASPKQSVIACCPGSELPGELFSWSFAILLHFKRMSAHVKAGACAEAIESSGSSTGKGPTMAA